MVLPVFAHDQNKICEFVQMRKIGGCIYEADADHIDETFKTIYQNLTYY